MQVSGDVTTPHLVSISRVMWRTKHTQPRLTYSCPAGDDAGLMGQRVGQQGGSRDGEQPPGRQGASTLPQGSSPFYTNEAVHPTLLPPRLNILYYLLAAYDSSLNTYCAAPHTTPFVFGFASFFPPTHQTVSSLMMASHHDPKLLYAINGIKAYHIQDGDEPCAGILQRQGGHRLSCRRRRLRPRRGSSSRP